LVTHNIEEAVLMCDRVLVFATNLDASSPTSGRLPHRATVSIRAFATWSNKNSEMTKPAVNEPLRAERFLTSALARSYLTTSNSLSGCSSHRRCRMQAKLSLPIIAAALHMTVDDLFPIAETLQMLRLRIEGGDIALTPEALLSRSGAVDERKHLFSGIC
jgi:NitT/TauT family transport system ATP-binding protein